jgi:hypothetical protein
MQREMLQFKEDELNTRVAEYELELQQQETAMGDLRVRISEIEGERDAMSHELDDLHAKMSAQSQSRLHDVCTCDTSSMMVCLCAKGVLKGVFDRSINSSKLCMPLQMCDGDAEDDILKEEEHTILSKRLVELTDENASLRSLVQKLKLEVRTLDVFISHDFISTRLNSYMRVYSVGKSWSDLKRIMTNGR